MLSLLIISVLSAFGIAVLLVEKGQDWPVRRFVILTRKFIYKINKNAEKVFDCTVCMSFWVSLLADLILLYFYNHFLWPLTGFITLGFTWFIMQFLNAIDNGKQEN
tara:strand:- start:1817 stop:2134 length:318 start_codon:yes stop_codon:yes gene_type:complete